VRVPSEAEEAARDLVRASEDARRIWCGLGIGSRSCCCARDELASLVGRLCCLRGMGTLTAFGLAVEIGDWNRFTGSSIGAYLGLVPSVASSGAWCGQGGITKDR
jgi:transposase IS116/IS110/IS902 family protein